jgi:protein TonB
VVPLVRVDPQYPPKAKQRRIEGWVDIEFTIGPAGTVENPKVIGASPRAVFEESALRAVRRWRYNPKIENGVAVARPGIRVRLRFELGGG